MPTTSELQSRLDAIRAARDSGVLTVTHGDTTTRYRSLEEMDRIISDLVAEINAASGTNRRPKYGRQKTKGL